MSRALDGDSHLPGDYSHANKLGRRRGMPSLHLPPFHQRPRLNQSIGSGQRWTRIEEAGSGKEIAERVRRGKASLRIFQSPWGIEFFICDTVDDTDGVRPPVEILVPSSQMPSVATNAGTGTGDVRTNNAPSMNGLGFGTGNSVFVALTMLCIASNLMAFVVSSGLPPMYVELDRLVQPGSLLSLLRTEGIILIISFVLLGLVRNVVERTVFQGLILGVLAADAVNDIALVYTGNWPIAIETALATAVSIPALVGILMSRRIGSPSS